MTWVIVFIYSWIIFLIFVDKAKLKRAVYGGFIATALGLLVDWAGHRLRLYHFQDNIIDLGDSSVFYAAGPLFTMGTLFFQYISPDRRLQAANVVVFSLAYLAVETLIVNSGGAKYVHWHYLASLAVDLLVFTALGYVGEVVMFRDKLWG
ncbi:MAG: hypothetical protein ACOY40_07755 [Bacillota bacterium]